MSNQSNAGILLNTKIWSLVTIAVVAVLIFDGIITNLPLYDLKSQKSFGIRLFFGLVIFVSVLSQATYLRIIKKKHSINPDIGYFRRYGSITYSVVSITQYIIIALLIITLLQVEILREYDTFTLRISISLSLFLSIGILALLAFRFLLWLKNQRDYIGIEYAVATILLTANSVFIAVFMSLEMQDIPSIIDSSRTAITSPQVRNYSVKEFQSTLSLISFISLWIASTMLLRQSRRKWGAIKFYVIVAIPLVYYLGAIQFIFSTIFAHYDILSSMQIYTFNVVNSILTRPVGGILFGVAFWTIARTIRYKDISDYMKFSAFGIMLLSMSNQDAGLYLLPYPPFGLSTISFIGISSYLLFVGIYYSAISVSINTEVRRSIEKSVEQELKFVSNIGAAHMEQEIQNKIKTLTKKSAEELKEQSGVEVSLPKEDIDEYIKLVISEKERMSREHSNNS